MFGWEDVLCEGEHPPSFIQLNYDTAKNRAGKVQIYLRFISPFLFLDGDDNLQFFLDFGRKFFANLYVSARCFTFQSGILAYYQPVHIRNHERMLFTAVHEIGLAHL